MFGPNCNLLDEKDYTKLSSQSNNTEWGNEPLKRELQFTCFREGQAVKILDDVSV